jgi:hypothetical protein
MKTITIELTDAEHDLIENASQLHFDITCSELPEGTEVDPITMDEYIKRTLIECSISALQEVEINPDVWLTSAPLDKKVCEKYRLER